MNEALELEAKVTEVRFTRACHVARGCAVALMRLALAVCCIAALPDALSAQDHWGLPVQGLRLSISTPKEKYNLGEKIKVRLSVTNATDKEVVIVQDGRHLRLALYTQDGTAFKPTRYGRWAMKADSPSPSPSLGSRWAASISARTSRTIEVQPLAKWFSIEENGTYLLVAMLSTGKWDDGFLVSNMCSIQIVPPGQKGDAAPAPGGVITATIHGMHLSDSGAAPCLLPYEPLCATVRLENRSAAALKLATSLHAAVVCEHPKGGTIRKLSSTAFGDDRKGAAELVLRPGDSSQTFFSAAGATATGQPLFPQGTKTFRFVIPSVLDTATGRKLRRSSQDLPAWGLMARQIDEIGERPAMEALIRSTASTPSSGRPATLVHELAPSAGKKPSQHLLAALAKYVQDFPRSRYSLYLRRSYLMYAVALAPKERVRHEPRMSVYRAHLTEKAPWLLGGLPMKALPAPPSPPPDL